MNLLTTADRDQLRRRAADPRFRPSIDRLRQRVERRLAEPIAVPSLPGGYYHDYFCPDHGCELYFRWDRPEEHRCPVDGREFTGAKFEAAWRWTANHRLSEAARDAAVLWVITAEPHLLDLVRSILDGYARRYEGYRGGEHYHINPGIATYTTLDESVWVIPLAWAFDAVRPEIGDAQRIADRLLRPAAEHLRERHYGKIHNFSCWHNAAIGTIAVVLGNQELAEFAFDGQKVQLEQGVLGDGLWYEGSLSYHFYSLWAIASLALTARQRTAVDLRPHLALRRMFEAPIDLAFPDGSLPATNDCWYFSSLLGDCCHGVPPSAEFYELAFAWYGGDRFGEVLERNYAKSARDSLTALLFGVDEIEPQPASAAASVLLPDSGLSVLRANDRQLVLKYGPHGGGHGHPDKLSLAVFAGGIPWSPDLGTPGYGFSLFESWYRQTISHNTVILDGRSQPPATGRLRRFRREGPFQIADAEVEFDGARLRRVILARPGYFLDLFVVDAERQCVADWIWRAAGELDPDGASEPVAPLAGDGYQHLSSPRRLTASPLVWRAGGAALRIWPRPEPGTECIAARAPGTPPHLEHSLVLLRRTCGSTIFASVIATDPAIARVEWDPGPALSSTVHTSEGPE
ncbi:MAG: heparinase II/III family protein, partial [Bryobacteraceae bacterium]